MGARKADVRRLLIFESLLLSIIGGLSGIIVAGLIGGASNLVLTHYANRKGVSGTIHAFLVTPLLIAATLVLIIVIGRLVSFYPSKRAARINPIEALKHE